jgi:hypothetical protein
MFRQRVDVDMLELFEAVPKYDQSKVAGSQGRHVLTGNQPAIDTSAPGR